MTKEEFVEKYGGIYEHSPWVAEAAYGAETLDEIRNAMKIAVDTAAYDKKLALICAHPELACMKGLTASSTSEQAGAGLNDCSPEELKEFTRLNSEYKNKFGFPFVVAVRGLHRDAILKQFRHRLHNDPVAEFETAMAQIHKIAGFRLAVLTN